MIMQLSLEIQRVWSDRLDVPPNTITDQQALERMTIVKEDYTIERVN